MAAARTIKVLVLNLCVEREPLYGTESGPAALRRTRCHLSQARWRCRARRVGRALDQLFDADRASLLTELTLGESGSRC